jgi:hypothetical protein
MIKMRIWILREVSPGTDRTALDALQTGRFT